MFSKNILGHSQNFKGTIWIVQGVWFFSRILFFDIENEKWIVGPRGQAIWRSGIIKTLILTTPKKSKILIFITF